MPAILTSSASTKTSRTLAIIRRCALGAVASLVLALALIVPAHAVSPDTCDSYGGAYSPSTGTCTQAPQQTGRGTYTDCYGNVTVIMIDANVTATNCGIPVPTDCRPLAAATLATWAGCAPDRAPRAMIVPNGPQAQPAPASPLGKIVVRLADGQAMDTAKPLLVGQPVTLVMEPQGSVTRVSWSWSKGKGGSAQALGCPPAPTCKTTLGVSAEIQVTGNVTWNIGAPTTVSLKLRQGESQSMNGTSK